MSTTKIFIKNCDPILLKKKFFKLDEYFRSKEELLEIVSPDGLFCIDNGRMFKLKPIDKDLHSEIFEDVELLFDSSYFEREPVLSQIPYDNIIVPITKFYYSQEMNNKKTFLKMVVEGIYDKKTTDSSMQTIPSEKYINFTPTNFYFLTNENFENILLKKELNVFLSMLM